MAMPCFLIVAAIAATSPAAAPKPSVPSSIRVARALEPPPMSRGRRSAHHSIRRLAADPPALPPSPADARPLSAAARPLAVAAR
jgi:hypothetical protein